MPREHRKRGKRQKPEHTEEEESYAEEQGGAEQSEAGPSWIVQPNHDVDPNAPFGFVDPDVKAYFRTVDERLKEWQEEHYPPEDDIDNDNPNEVKRLFLVAALEEMSGKEKQLATDPDCSAIIERMAYSTDDFIKRVFLDRLAGSFEILAKHRFASHVLQTLLSVSRGALSRESKGKSASAAEQSEEEGKLPTMTDLVKSMCDELLPSTASLIMDPFASHVLRTLFILLSPALATRHPNEGPEPSSKFLRSKKSAKFRRKQGPMASIFGHSEDGPNESGSMPAVPPVFEELLSQCIQTLRTDLTGNEVRALAGDQVACPVLVLLLELECTFSRTNEVGSLMDSISVGLIAATLQKPSSLPPASDYVSALIREPVSSHLLETLVSLSPLPVFRIIWDQHFVGQLQRIAVHPIGNFVVATAIERLPAKQLTSTAGELAPTLSKQIKTGRTRVLQALVERSTALKSCEQSIVDSALEAFELTDDEKRKDLVHCVMRLQTYKEYRKSKDAGAQQNAGTSDKRSSRKQPDSEHTAQGSILLQTILNINEPFNAVVLDCLASMPLPELLGLAQHVHGSRVLDAVLNSPAVPSRAKRKLVMAFIGHYHELVDDKMGSHVGEHCWSFADPYLKEKIARSLFDHETALRESVYGRFFANRLFLHELKHKPDAWKARQSRLRSTQNAEAASGPTTKPKPTQSEPTPQGPEVAERTEKKKRKREVRAKQDEIDAVFSAASVGKYKKGSLASDFASDMTIKPSLPSTSDLDAVLGAIKVVPQDHHVPKKRKK